MSYSGWRNNSHRRKRIPPHHHPLYINIIIFLQKATNNCEVHNIDNNNVQTECYVWTPHNNK